MTVTVDGRVIAADRPGWLIVANAPQYAARINPASRAIASDGLLDAVFMPAANLRDCVNWVARAWTRQHLRDARLIYATGRHVTVEAPAPIVHQVDGEHSPEFDNGHPLTLSVEPRTLPVLCP
jgi:diacylglycerol kinase family enzyme